MCAPIRHGAKAPPCRAPDVRLLRAVLVRPANHLWRLQQHTNSRPKRTGMRSRTMPAVSRLPCSTSPGDQRLDCMQPRHAPRRPQRACHVERRAHACGRRGDEQRQSSARLQLPHTTQPLCKGDTGGDDEGTQQLRSAIPCLPQLTRLGRAVHFVLGVACRGGGAAKGSALPACFQRVRPPPPPHALPHPPKSQILSSGQSEPSSASAPGTGLGRRSSSRFSSFRSRLATPCGLHGQRVVRAAPPPS